MEISDRAQRLLKVLVERYIRKGQPVGSRVLARNSGMDLSSATVRNVMADLEEMGLIRSPHTSAGRVPTVQGYRLFVDSLLTVRELQEMEIRDLESRLRVRAGDPKKVLQSASSLLSEITSLAGVIMMPRQEQQALRQLEFLPLSNNRVLAILVLNEREVQNRILHTSREYSPSELQQAANYLNEAFAGKELRQVRDKLLREMRDDQESMNHLMVDAIEMARKAFAEGEGENESAEGDYLLAGETNLMSYAEMADMEKLRQLFEAFARKRDILHLLDQALTAQGIQIFIGEESGYQVFDDCSLVTAPYKMDGETLGVLGVIGPTRMPYDRVIPIVDVTARLLGAALNQLK